MPEVPYKYRKYKPGITYPCPECNGTGQFKLEPTVIEDGVKVEKIDESITRFTVEEEKEPEPSGLVLSEKDVFPMTDEQKNVTITSNTDGNATDTE